MNYCTKCGTPNDEDAKFCKKCGAKFEPREFFDEDYDKTVVLKNAINPPEQHINNSVEQTKKCVKCGAEIAFDSKFCYLCGTNFMENQTEQIPKNVDKKKTNKIIPILIAIFVLLLLSVGVMFAIVKFTDINVPVISSFLNAPEETPTDLTTEEPFESTEPEIPEETTKDNNSSESESSTEEESTKSLSENGLINQLFKPDGSYYVNIYTAYCYCHETSVQDYVKMRFGPDKEKYEVVTKLDNNTLVTVESTTYNGWTLCKYDDTEGWIRSDFLYSSPVTGNTVNIVAEEYPSNTTVIFKQWNKGGYTYITSTDAAIGQEIISSYGKLEHVGFILYDDNYSKLKSYDHIPTIENNTKFFFEMNDELGYILTPSTKYYYKCYAVVNNITYTSDYQTFTTLNN